MTDAQVANVQQQIPTLPSQDLPAMVQDYCTEFLQVSKIREQGLKSAEDTMEAVLSRLDEFGEQLDYVCKNYFFLHFCRFILAQVTFRARCYRNCY